jgi:hypothetical protein
LFEEEKRSSFKFILDIKSEGFFGHLDEETFSGGLAFVESGFPLIF